MEAGKLPLALLPPEVLDSITSMLDGESLVFLWMSGDRTLHSRMTHGGVTQAVFNFGTRRAGYRRIPFCLSTFSKLKIFKWIMSSQDIQDPIRVDILRKLPPSLRELHLNRPLGGFAEPFLFDGVQRHLSDCFPQLERLVVPKLPLMDKEVLAKSITWLEWEEGGGILSDSLRTLVVRQIGNTVFSTLLTTRPQPKFPREVARFLSTPSQCSNLTHFECHWIITTALAQPESWDILPRDLTKLTLFVETEITEQHLARLPLGLRQLSLSSDASMMLDSAPCTSAFTSTLPRTIEDLSLRHGRIQLMTLLPGAFEKLPPNLTALNVAFHVDQLALQQRPLISFTSLSKLPTTASFPASLTVLECPLESLDHLPPMLVRLSCSISSLDNVNASCLASMAYLNDLEIKEGEYSRNLGNPFWPSSLTRLVISTGPRFEDAPIGLVDDEAMAWKWIRALPPGITDLQLASSCAVFNEDHIAALPRGIRVLGLISKSSDGMKHIPRSVTFLIMCLPYIGLDDFNLRFVPPLCESLIFLGSSLHLTTENFTYLPKRVGLIRLRAPSIPDDLKRVLNNLNVRVMYSRSD